MRSASAFEPPIGIEDCPFAKVASPKKRNADRVVSRGEGGEHLADRRVAEALGVLGETDLAVALETAPASFIEAM
jgi:hypothetical protein